MLIRPMLSFGFNGGAGSLGGTPVLPRGELHCDGGEDKEEERRSREVPMPLERRRDEVDHERGAQPGQKKPAVALRTRLPDGSPCVADEDHHKPKEGQKGEQAGLGALLEIQVVDLSDALESRSVLQPRVLEGPCPRAGEGTLLPCRPGDPPVGSPWTAVPVDDNESAQGHRKHSSGHDEDPESPPENR